MQRSENSAPTPTFSSAGVLANATSWRRSGVELEKSVFRARGARQRRERRNKLLFDATTRTERIRRPRGSQIEHPASGA